MKIYIYLEMLSINYNRIYNWISVTSNSKNNVTGSLTVQKILKFGHVYEFFISEILNSKTEIAREVSQHYLDEFGTKECTTYLNNRDEIIKNNRIRLISDEFSIKKTPKIKKKNNIKEI